MRQEVEKRIDDLLAERCNRCQAIGRIGLEFALSLDERAYFDARFPRTKWEGDGPPPSHVRIRMIQETLADRWAGRYLVYRDLAGNVTYLRRDPSTNTVTEIALEELERQAALVFSDTGYACHPTQTKERALGWTQLTEPLREMPSSFAWKDEPGLTFNRFDFEVAGKPTPLFDDFISRCESNGDALMAFIWSIFERSNKGHQYLWLYGEGQDGKGSLMRLLARLLDRAYVALDAKDKYWLASCVGKRLGVFNDVVDTTFPMRAQFKGVTGGDMMNIEQKYKKSYSTFLDIKIVFTTNKNLQISSEFSNVRRCICVTMAKNPSLATANYEEELWKERAGILFKCREAYRRCLDANGQIKFDMDVVREHAEQTEIQFQSLFDDHLAVAEDSFLTREVLFELFRSRFGAETQKYSEFKQWLTRTYPVKERKRKMTDGRVLRVMEGLGHKRYPSKSEPLPEKIVVKNVVSLRNIAGEFFE